MDYNWYPGLCDIVQYLWSKFAILSGTDERMVNQNVSIGEFML